MSKHYEVRVSTRTHGTVALDAYRGEIHLGRVESIDYQRLEQGSEEAGRFTLAEAHRLQNALSNLYRSQVAIVRVV